MFTPAENEKAEKEKKIKLKTDKANWFKQRYP